MGARGAIIPPVSTPKPPIVSAEQQVLALMGACEKALGERRESDALRALQAAAALLPEHPRVLHEQARRLLATGDAQGARELLERAVAVAAQEPALWHSLAACFRVLVLNEKELVALDRALVLQPRDVLALLYKGAALDRMGKRRAAARIYGNAIQAAGPGARFAPTLEPLVREAQRRVTESTVELSAFLDRRLGSQRDGHEFQRVNRSIDMLLGRARSYAPRPSSLFFPHLHNYEYYGREQFPWLESLEAATAAIRDECLAVLSDEGAGLEPYIAYRDGLPLDQWKDLNHSRRWSAYFLWKEGQRLSEHAARCPRTMTALDAIPRVDIAGHGPTAFYSILDAHTHIPAHHGITNTRLTVHLPLIVPAGCRFRVGNETREWKAGEAWVFDDTIEHEAWNDADVPRAILIFDVWNPELTERERDVVREATLALAEFSSADGMDEVGL